MIIAIAFATIVAAGDTTGPRPARPAMRPLARQAPAAAADRWFGTDKVKHFFMSALVQSGAYTAARAAGASRSNAQAAASVTSVAFGVAKEVQDRRRARPFSARDLAWDAAGALTAAALLNGTR